LYRLTWLLADPGAATRAKAAEMLVLRHENAVLRRHVSRVRYDPADVGVVRGAGAAPPPQALARDLPRHGSDAADLTPQTGRG
jgi:hypothetical protein